VIDEFAKQYLHDELRWVRGSLLRKLDGLSEYDIRRPLTRTGTNLLGLVKHLTLSEWRYFGSTFNRPFPGPVPSFDHPGYANRDYLWVPEGKSRAQVIDGYERAREHADATIDALPIEAPGHVPWWPQPDVKLFNVLVHVITETHRHAGYFAKNRRINRIQFHTADCGRRSRLGRAPNHGRKRSEGLPKEQLSAPGGSRDPLRE